MDTATVSFKPHAKGDARRRSAVALIKILLKVDQPDALPRHVEKLIDSMLWAITEADGKHNTRHRSERALNCSQTNLLQHEHVFPKKSMIQRLRKAKSEEEVNQILSLAVGCIVLKEEHSLLEHSLINEVAEGDGWERYHKADIAVFNVETGQRVARK